LHSVLLIVFISFSFVSLKIFSDDILDVGDEVGDKVVSGNCFSLLLLILTEKAFVVELGITSIKISLLKSRLNNYIILTDINQNIVLRFKMMMSVNMEFFVVLLIVKKKFKSKNCMKWILMRIFICLNSKRFGVHLLLNIIGK
jgi:hypothetical protein